MSLDTAAAIAKLRSLTVTFDSAAMSANPFYPQLTTIVPSDGFDEEYGWLAALPQVREFLGERIAKEISGAKFTLENKTWESTIKILREHIEDDRLGMYDNMLAQLGARAATHPDKYLFEILVNGESNTCFDGQFFFDTDHVWDDSGTQSNDLTYNATDPTAPTVDEFKAAFEQAVEALIGFKDSEGEPLNQPTVEQFSDLMIVVPKEHRQSAHEAIRSTVISNSSNIVVDAPRIVTSAYLTGNTKFYLFNLGDVLKPFVFQARKELMRELEGLDSIRRKDVLFMTEARYNLGYLAWWTAVLTTFN